MSRESVFVGFALLVLVVCGFLYFPGHTYLHSDTQIYLPILDHLRDPSLYAKDPIALRPHVSYTIYDETAVLLRHLTGLDFRVVLHAQQIVYRYCGLLGMFLIGRAFGFPVLASLLLTGIYSLGATIGGPSVLTFEYEPVPRGYANALLVFAIGLAATGRWVASACAIAVAILYHPPTAVAVLLTFSILVIRDRRWKAFAPIAAAIAATWILSRLQAGESEPQRFFATVEPALEKLQRLRGSYNFITMWGGQWIRNYELLAAIFALAWLRLRTFTPAALRFFLVVPLIYGLAMIPTTWVLLEWMKWAFMTQFQPARAVLFITLMTLVAAAVCGIEMARRGRTLESIVWFVVAFAIPAQADTSQVLFPDLRSGEMAARFGVVVLLAILAWLAMRGAGISKAAWAAALLLPFYLFPGPAGVRNYRNQDQPEIRELAAWAQANTPKDAVFLFPDAGQELYPGFFRVYSQRNVYVDWKGGGQVNLLREFGLEWWERWQKSGEGKFLPAKIDELAKAGVDYIVLKAGARMPERTAVRDAGGYVVYRISPILSSGQ